MAASMSKVVRPLPKGQITIPVAIRRALGIDETSLLEVGLENGKIVISKVEIDREPAVREYSDEEIATFLEEDTISPELAQWVRERYPPRLKWLE
jgi:AbrB family looped-hinge helix DNA binding protein